MTSLELDHVYFFSDEDFKEKSKVSNLGFSLTSEFIHINQGTANQCILLEDHYFEFIYLKNKNEAVSSPVKSHLRAEWRENGNCPFGVCLRGDLSEEDKKEFEIHKPAYSSGTTIYYHKSNLEDLKFPKIFVIEYEGIDLENMKPKYRNIDMVRDLISKNSKISKRIESVSIQHKSNNTYNIFNSIKGLTLSSESEYFMSVEMGVNKTKINDVLEFK